MLLVFWHTTAPVVNAYWRSQGIVGSIVKRNTCLLKLNFNIYTSRVLLAV